MRRKLSNITKKEISLNFNLFIKLSMAFFMLCSLNISAQSPGGVSQSAGLVNGVEYTYYEGYQNAASLTAPAGITGAVKNTGYIDDLNNPQNIFLNEDADTFSLKLETSLEITSAGTYNFRVVNVEDSFAVYVDNTLRFSGDYVFITSTYTSPDIELTAGNHTIEVRYSENGSGQLFNLEYDGPDSGNTFTSIPSNKLFITSPIMTAWFKADLGTTATEAGTITAWTDQSANANNLTSANGNNGNTKFYGTTSGQLINFNPSIVFTDDQLGSADHANGIAYGKKGKTVFSVITKTTANAGSGWITAVGADNSTSSSFGLYTTGDDAYLTAWSDNTIKADFISQNDAPYILGGHYQNNEIVSSNNSFLYGDGAQLTNDTQNWTTLMNDFDDLSIGTHNDYTGDGHDGRIMEVIHYPWVLTTVERQKVESYLAIKYGVSLNADYFASSGTKIWDATEASSNYNNGITFIGKDIASALDQRVSKSTKSGSILTYALDNNFTVANTDAARSTLHANDLQFLGIGNDGLGTDLQSTELDLALYSSRLKREWRVQSENFSQTVNLKFDGQGTTSSKTNYLVKSSDGNFSTGTTQVGALDANGEITGVTLNDGDYFTIISLSAAPGGVPSNLAFWVKADEVTNIASGWDDKSPNGNLIETVGSLTLNTGNTVHNFNPYINNFSGSNFFSDDTSSLAPDNVYTQRDLTVFAIANASSAGNGRIIGIDNENSPTHNGGEPGFGVNAGNLNMYRFWESVDQTSTLSVTPGQSSLYSWSPVGTTLDIGLDGLTQNFTIPTGGVWGDHLNLGYSGFSTGGGAFPGDIQEVIWYNGSLNATQKQQVNSYLALKYGVTLNQNSAIDYLAGDGTTKSWDVLKTDGNTFIHDIAGIGRDDKASLNQKQSRSVNSDAQVSIYLGDHLSGLKASNALNASTFSATNSFLTWSNNNLSIAPSITYETTSSGTDKPHRIMPRVWKVQETGTVGEVTVHAPEYFHYLLVHSSSDFTTGTPTEYQLQDDGSGNLVAKVDLTDGQYFTFAYEFFAVEKCEKTAALIHGADNDDDSEIGISAWVSNEDGTFDTEEYAYGGFDRESTWGTTGVFGNDWYSSTYFDDANEDGITDLIHVTENNNNSIYVYLGNGDNTYKYDAVVTSGMQKVTDGYIFAGLSAHEQGWIADVNGDSKIDYIFSGADNKVHVYLGNGDGTFAKTRITTSLIGASGFNTSGRSANEEFLLADVTNDGYADLVGTFDDSGTGRLQVWRGKSDGTFVPELYFNELLEDSGGSNSSGSAQEEYSQFVDVDNDGDLDYAHAEAFGAMGIWVYKNLGQGRFSTTATRTTITADPLGGTTRFANSTNAEQSFFQDVTGDGNADYITAVDNLGADSGITVYKGNGDGTFENVANKTKIPLKFGAGNTGNQSTFISCGVILKPEICNNCIDDNGDGKIDSADPLCSTVSTPAFTENNSGSVALIYGDDRNGTSGLGISSWVSNDDGTFSTTENSFSGFSRDNIGTENFGDSAYAQSFYGDVDNDGDKDLVHVTEDNNRSIYVYINNGNNTFQTNYIETTKMAITTDGKHFAGISDGEQGWLADVNGDYKLDYVFSGNDGQIHSYFGNGDGTFKRQRVTSRLTGSDWYHASGRSVYEQFFLEDVNKDFVADLVGVFDDWGKPRMVIWRGYGDGRFNPTPVVNKLLNDVGGSNSGGSGQEEFSAMADVNNDGYIDYLHAEAYGKMQLHAFLNDGTGDFNVAPVKTNITVGPLNGATRFANLTDAEQSFFIDVNKDGKVDYITATDNSGSNSGISVYLGNGDGSFATEPITTTISNFGVGTNYLEEASIQNGVFFKAGETKTTTVAQVSCCKSGTVAPILSTYKASTGPINLDDIHTATAPTGSTLVWSTENGTTAYPSTFVTMPTNTVGTYYAYYYDSVNACYSPASAPVIVTADFDGDGIDNATDLDDDNDGVLDIDEISCTISSTQIDKTGVTVTSDNTFAIGGGDLNKLVNGTDTQAAILSPSGTTNGTILFKFEFPSVKKLNLIELGQFSGGNLLTVGSTVKIEASTDDSNWVTLANSLSYNTTEVAGDFAASDSWKIEFNNNTEYKYYRIVNLTVANGGGWLSQAFFGQYNCVDLDTDNDGISNRLDLDSDGDGCSDALESGATTSTAKDYQFPNVDTQNSDGLVDAVDATGDGFIDYNSTYSLYATSSTLKSCLDSDGDGVNDVIDIDDDNDGILDKNECTASSVSNIGTFSTGAGIQTKGTIMQNGESIGFTIDHVSSFGPQNSIHAPFFNDANTYDPVVNPVKSGLAFTLQDGTPSTYTFTFDKPITNPRLHIWSMGNGTVNPKMTFSRDVILISKYQSSLTQENSTQIQTSSTSGGNGTIEIIGTMTSFNFSLDQGENWWSLLLATYNNPDCSLDTDNDGIPNSLDLDSDGDGCLDVNESGGIDADNDGVLDGDGFNTNGQVTTSNALLGTSYDGVTGGEIEAVKFDVTTAPQDNNTASGATTFTVAVDANKATVFNAGTPDFTTSTADASSGLNYKWQVDNVDITASTDGSVYTNFNTATLNISNVAGLIGKTYKVIISHNSDTCTTIEKSAKLVQLNDFDNDGVDDATDLDDDNDGILDSVEGSTDTDGDGRPNDKDLDSDGDGCFDAKESGGIDANNDGVLDGDGFDGTGQVTTGGSTLATSYNGVTGAEVIAVKASLATSPQDKTINEADTVTFGALASAESATSYAAGSPVYGTDLNANADLTYQWYIGNAGSGVALTETSPYSGVTSSTLTITNAPLSFNTNKYYVVVTHTNNACVSLESTAATLTVDPFNTAPVNTVPIGLNAPENTGTEDPIGITGIGIADADNNLASAVLSSANNGIINITASGAAIVTNNDSSSVTITGTQEDINNSLATATYKGNMSYVGNDTLTLLATDGADTPLTDSDTFMIAVGSVTNAAPVNTVPATQPASENTDKVITGISVADADGNLVTTEIKANSGTITVTGSGSVAVSTNGTSTVTMTGSQADINATIASITYKGNANFSGNDTITVTSTDSASSPETDIDTFTVNVAAVDFNPVNTMPVAQSTSQNVSKVISGVSVTDADDNLASTQISVTNGTLTVPTAGGGSISNNGTASVTIAGTETEINAALASITYAPTNNFSGGSTLTVLSTDSTSGTPLTDSDDLTITVGSVTAPLNTIPAAQTTPQNVNKVITGISVTDADGNLTMTQVSVTNGTLSVTTGGGGTINNDGTASVTIIGTEAQINAALASVTYAPTNNYSGGSTLTVLSTDSTSGTALTDSDNLAISVTAPANTAPVTNAVASTSMSSSAGATALPDPTATDPDGTIAGYVVKTLPTGGILQYTEDGTGTVKTVTANEELTPDEIKTLTFDPAGTTNANTSFTIAAKDNDGTEDSTPETVGITLTNAEPVTNAVASTSMSSSAGATALPDPTATDPDGTIAGYVIKTLPTGGILQYTEDGTGTVKTVTANEELTPDEIKTLTFDPAGTTNANTSFTIAAKDNDGTEDSTPETVGITLTNAEPVTNAVASTSMSSSAGATALPDPTATDPDGTIAGYVVKTLPTGGILQYTEDGTGTVKTVTANEELTPDEIKTLTFDPAGTTNANTSFTIAAKDNDGTEDSTPETVGITLTNAEPVTNAVASTSMSSSAGATALPDPTATDPDGTIAGYVVKTLPTGGILQYTEDGTGTVKTVTANEELTPDEIKTLTFDPAGTTNANTSFTIAAKDNDGTEDSTPETVGITLTNSEPVTNAVSSTSMSSSAGATALPDPTATDPDGTIAGYVVKTLPTGGILQYTEDGTGTVKTVTANEELTPDEIKTLTFDPAGTTNADTSFTLAAKDGEGLEDSTPETVGITLTNAEPVTNAVASTSMSSSAGATALPDPSGTDSDGSIASYVVKSLPSGGILELADGTDVTVGMELTPTQAAGLTFDPDGTTNTDTSFTITAKDNEGLEDSTPATVSITLNNAEPTTNDLTSVAISSSAGASALPDPTGNDDDGSIASYVIKTLPSGGTLELADGTDVTVGMELTPTQAAGLTFDPDGTTNANTSFTIAGKDNEGLEDSTPATVSIILNNAEPTTDDLTAVAINSSAGASALPDPTGNDDDGSIASYVVKTLPSGGTLELADGTDVTVGQVLTPTQANGLTFDPDGTTSANTSFTIAAKDNEGLEDSTPATVSITLNNTEPTTDDLSAVAMSSSAGASALPDPTGNDGDGSIASYVVKTLPSGGTLELADGTDVTVGMELTPTQANGLTFDPDGTTNTDTTFTIAAKDNEGLEDSTPATVSITLNNAAPIAQDDSVTINEDTNATINVITNDSDLDGSINNTTVDLDTSSPGVQNTKTTPEGVWTVNASGVVSFDPIDDYNGTANLTYTVKDNEGVLSNSGTISAIVTPVNDAPVAANDAVATDPNVPVAIPVLTNDTDVDNTTLTVSSITSNPTQGSVTINANGTITYTPNPSFTNGTDTFTYQVCDAVSGGLCDTASVSVSVPNTPLSPTANPDTNTVAEGGTLNVVLPGVLSNDTDANLDTLSIVDFKIGADTFTAGQTATITDKGTLKINSDGSYEFTALGDFNGTFPTVTYTVSDGTSTANSTSTLTIDVTSVNDAPVANNDTVTVDEDTNATVNVTTNDTDVDGAIDATTVDLDPATAGIQNTVTTPEGVWTVDSVGEITFDPVDNYNGTATISYTVKDNQGLETSNPGTVSVIVNAVNDTPVAANDSVTVNEDTDATVNVVTNDSDNDGTIDATTVDLDPATLGVQNTKTTPQGEWSVDANGVVTFDPADNYNGTATLDYTVKDNLGKVSSPGTISVSVTPVNDSPVLVVDMVTISEDSNATVNVVANDTDVDGTIDPTSVDLDPTTPGVQNTVTTPEGVWSVDANGVVTFDPVDNFNGTATISYTVKDNDGLLASTPGTISVMVTSVNDLPVVTDDTVTTTEDANVSINVLTNDTDPDGTIDATSVDLDPSTPAKESTITTPAGVWTVDANGVVTLDPAENFTGTATLPYTVKDDEGTTSNQGTINVTVEKDTDKDGIADTVDADDDNDGIPDSVEQNGDVNADLDGDGIPNHLDLDSDGDGMTDAQEAGGIDANGDGKIDSFTDANNDGLDDTIAATPLPTPNTDGTPKQDFLDADSDGDGIPDNLEAQAHASYEAPKGTDTDGDGIDDAYDSDNGGTPIKTPVNSDSDSIPNHLDLDSDGDGIIDNIEVQSTIGYQAPGVDTDGNGLADNYETTPGSGILKNAPVNSDGTDLPDYLDLDSDNDAVSDSVEAYDTDGDDVADKTATGTDADGDGIDDGYDVVTGGTNAPNAATNGGQDVTGFPNDQNANTAEIDYRDDSTPASAALKDTDGDSVKDITDKDDDNDGIIDSVESLGFIPTASAADDCGFPSVNFTSPTYVAGTGLTGAGSINAQYRFENVANYGGSIGIVDAIVEITDIKGGASLLNIDKATTGDPKAWQPEFTVPTPTGNTAQMAFKVKFVLDGTTNLFNIGRIGGVIYDIDGANAQEAVILSRPGLYAVDSQTLLNVVPNTTAGTVVFTGPDDTYSGVDLSPKLAAYFNYYNLSEFEIRFSAELLSSSANTNLGSVLFNICGINGLFEGNTTTANPSQTNGTSEPSGPGTFSVFTVNDGIDSDQDGIPDEKDLDSDNDGIPDNVEAQETANYKAPDADTDSDGLSEVYEGSGDKGIQPVDTDGDGTPDYLDTDSDNDGKNDTVEAGFTISTSNADADGDGLVDGYDDVNTTGNPFDVNDDQNNGAADTANTNTSTTEVDYREALDTDGDGIIDLVDTDDDNDGITDTIEQKGNPTRDTDGDGTPDHLDLDSDGDGVKDIVEAGGTDANNDGKVDDINPDGTLINDIDNDGLDDGIDGNNGEVDSDNDGIYDFQDTDDDGDGVDTKDEDVQTADGNPTNDDTDGDTIPNYLDSDDDGDGIDTKDEDIQTADGNPTNDDSDGDNTPNYLDADDDGDGVDTKDEDINNDSNPTNDDSDNDTIPNYLDTDDDGDGVDTKDEDVVTTNGNPSDDDTDGDTIPNYLDPDDDGDGIDTKDEDVETVDGNPANDDTDNDNTPDYLDPDDDGDGINTKDEDVNNDNNPTNDDTDNNGTPNYLDPDDDGDGVTTKDEDVETVDGNPTNDDTDNDGTPDYLDPDDDGDGVNTSDEDVDNDNNPTNDNTDSDTLPNYLDPDDDGDGINTVDEDVNGDNNPTNDNTDSDSLPNYLDPDDDGDGINTTDEDLDNDNNPTNDDSDNDGTPNYLDPDDDGDGINTSDEDANNDGNPTNDDSDSDGTPDYLDNDDNDGDGIADSIDEDDDNDGIPDSVEQNGNPTRDTDGDGIPDHLDLDADNDGILDIIEAGGTDSNNDGRVDNINPDGSLTNDSDNDGLDDAVDTNNGGTSLPMTDSDNVAPADFQDTDSDNDGVTDLVEGGTSPTEDANNDGMMDNTTDTDNDGISDVVDSDNGGTPANTPDTDNDSTLDFQDADDDSDGVNTADEDVETVDGNPTNDDTDNDGTPDYLDPDDDGDGVNTSDEDVETADGNPMNDDTDNDGTPDYLDPDDDGDGVNTSDEDPNNDGNPANDDSDGDGTPDYLDNDDNDGDGIADSLDEDDDNDGIPDSVEQNGNPAKDTDGDGTPDHLDLDSDNDGILDIVEAGGTDANNDGKVDGINPDGSLTNDTDNDGLEDTVDANNGGTSLPIPDTDGDGTSDYQDLDSDNDGVSDLIEGGTDPAVDANNDGKIDDASDADTDGISDIVDKDSGGKPADTPDTDNDGILDFQDSDDDGDGVDTKDEDIDKDGDSIDDDTDNDSIPNYLDPDDDGDGVNTKDEDANNDNNPTNDDTDNDGTPDYLDTDSDGDGINDSVEGSLDSDGDGIPNFQDSDDDGDGVDTKDEDIDKDGDPTDDDTDGDGTPNYLDSDDDGDGIDSKDEDVNSDNNPANDDTDNDGTPNYLDSDDDGDGINTSDEDVNNDGNVNNDNTDGDGIPNYLDSDDDGDGVNTGEEDVNNDGNPTNDDTDSDSTPDYLDSDDDGDGVSTEDEDVDNDGNPTNDDTDSDSTPDYLDSDDDGDGVSTDDEDVDNDGNPTNDDTDSDSTPDYLDSDDDGDGVSTDDEDIDNDGNPTNDDTDSDSTPDYLDSDDDGDGVSTEDEDVDNDGNPTNDDTDSDSTPDYLDSDDDNDGVSTEDEDVDQDGNPTDDDTDGDGTPNYLDTDDDGDGIDTEDEDANNDGDVTNDDTDNDGTPNYLDNDDTSLDSDNDSVPDIVDLDDDNDGIPDLIENGGDFTLDTDGDGTPDHLDLDSDGDGIFDLVESGSGAPDADNDGVIDGSQSRSGRNGIFDALETSADSGTLLREPRDTDGDGKRDFQDTDDDGDGIDTADEDVVAVDGDPTNDDTDGDGIPNYLDNDDDGDGILSINESMLDCDEDNIPDHIDVTECDLVPKGFSPNGDGVNDVLIIPALAEYPNFKLEIYNRFGNTVYTYQNKGQRVQKTFGWDGKSNVSTTKEFGVPVGTYFYTIYFNKGNKKPIAGWVYLNR
ncbi:Ig-like domain-containing protein [Lutibacter sp. Hel_I_33_5]|uniref:Ig-like domain-containing protein n=1 Tax=Lutibacter sp. Hel_I_33_5 TaxID=1566289 RepID=UPI00119D2F09|nr:Ig-like domain-containing protein [Lutibacter sp. Hel_I_33_5]